MDEIWRRFVNIVGNHRSGEAPRRSLGRVLLSGHSFEGRAASCTKRVLVDGWWMILTLEKGFIWVLYGFYWCFMMSFDFLWCLMIFYDVLYFFYDVLWFFNDVLWGVHHDYLMNVDWWFVRGLYSPIFHGEYQNLWTWNPVLQAISFSRDTILGFWTLLTWKALT